MRKATNWKKEFTNFELWKLAECEEIKINSVFEDQEGNQIIYTGVAFQVYYTEANETDYYVGLCKGDKWRFINVLTEADIEDEVTDK